METPVETIIDRIEAPYTKIVRLYHDVTIEDLLVPALSNGWSIKDTLAHFAAWDARCAALLSEGRDSNAPLKASPDVEALNDEFYKERRGWSWEEVETEFRSSHKALLEAIRALPPERLKDIIVQDSIAEETWQHYEEHLPDLEAWHARLTGVG
jgi:hypothetical protein